MQVCFTIRIGQKNGHVADHPLHTIVKLSHAYVLGRYTYVHNSKAERIAYFIQFLLYFFSFTQDFNEKTERLVIDSTDQDIPDEHLLKMSRKKLNKLLKGRSDGQTINNRRKALKREQYDIKTRSEQKEAKKIKKQLDERVKKITASIHKDWKKDSEKHRDKFEQLLKIWESDPESMTIVNDNGACFQKQFLIGSGSYGTEVYICLGSDGIERAIKRLPKLMCQNFLKSERDILTSQNAVESPRVVNYYFYDDTSHADFGYLILSLREQNLEEYIKEKGAAITESHARKMIHQVLEGLKALHNREPRILHRDLKPTNILVDNNGDLVLSDFGIGRFFPEQGIYYSYLTFT